MNQQEIQAACDRLDKLARAITDSVIPGEDAAGGTVGCLTEAVMGVTAGLCRIADAIESLAEAMRDRRG